MNIGEQLNISAVGYNAYGTLMPRAVFTFTSSNGTIIRVTQTAPATATITAMGNGLANLTVSSGTGSEVIPIQVGLATPVPSVVTLTPAGPITLLNLTPVSVLASVRDQFFNPMTNVPIAWSTSNAAGVSVNSVGQVTAVRGASEAVVTALAGTPGFGQASASITVFTEAPIPTSIVPSVSTIASPTNLGAIVYDQFDQPFFAPSMPTAVVISPQGPITLVGVGSQVQFTAWEADEFGLALAPVASFTGSDPTHASVTSGGLTQEVASGGQVTVTAAAGSLSSTVEVLTT